jgi:hypothetical protein
MANYFDKFDPKPAPRGGGVPARGPAPGFSDTPELRGRQVQASTGQSQAATGKTIVDTKLGLAKVPFAGTEAEGRARQAQAAGTAAGLGVETARLKQKQAADKELSTALKIIEASNTALKSPVLGDIIGRTVNPVYGMFGHYDEADDKNPKAGQPRLLWGGSRANDFVNAVNYLRSQAGITGRQAIRPDPNPSNVEQKMASTAEANIAWDMSPQTFAQNIKKYRDEKIRLANKYLTNQAAERRRSLKEGIVPQTTFREGEVAEDANGVRAAFKKGKWVELP